MAAFHVLMVIGKLSVNRVTSSLLESEEVLIRIENTYVLYSWWEHVTTLLSILTKSCHLCSVPDNQDLETFSMRI